MKFASLFEDPAYLGKDRLWGAVSLGVPITHPFLLGAGVVVSQPLPLRFDRATMVKVA